MHTPGHSGGSGRYRHLRWIELVTALKVVLPEMCEEFVERVQQIPGYADQAVSLQDLRQTAGDSIGLIIDALSGPQHYPGMLRFGHDLGTRRARQGLAADSLMSAVRLDFPVIWSALLRVSRPEDATLLAARAEEVWRVVDDYAEATRSSYVETRIAMAQEQAGVRQEFIAALFGAQGRLGETRERFATAFDVPADAPYVVVAATGREVAGLRAIANVTGVEHRVFLHEAENRTYLFWPDPGSVTSVPAVGVDLMARLDAVSCGVARTDEGLAGLAAAARIASALAELAAARGKGPATVDGDWPRLARMRMDATGVELGALLDDRLAGLRPDEVERLRETVACFLGNGSVSATATALYCHRNTIVNRLRRFREITGIDLAVPAQAARVVVAWS